MSNATDRLAETLGDLRSGDDARMRAAIETILAMVLPRAERIARRMLRDSPRVHRWEQTDDLVQQSLIRLHKALEDVRPDSPGRLFGLLGLQIRRSLVDMARHHLGPEGAGGNHLTAGGGAAADDPGAVLDQHASGSLEPNSLAEWTEFHLAVDDLPTEERDVFSLLWYDGLTQVEAAEVLGVSERTIRNRWRSARLLLHERLRVTNDLTPKP